MGVIIEVENVYTVFERQALWRDPFFPFMLIGGRVDDSRVDW